MGIREEIAGIKRHAAAIEEIGQAIAAEGADFWEKQSECQMCEDDKRAVAEADAESVGLVNGEKR